MSPADTIACLFQSVQSAESIQEAYDEACRQFPQEERELISALKALLTTRCIGEIAARAQKLLADHCGEGENFDWLCKELETEYELETEQECWLTSVVLTLGHLLQIPKTVSSLASLVMKSDDRKIRSRCLSILAEGAELPHVCMAIAEIVKGHNDMYVRVRAVKALEKGIESKETQRVAISAFSDPENIVGILAGRLLLNAPASDYLRDLLVAELSLEQRNSMGLAARALSRWIHTSAEVRQALYAYVRKHDSLVDVAAESLTEAVKDPSVRAELIAILQSELETESVRSYAAEALKSALNEDDVRQCYLAVYSKGPPESSLCRLMACNDMRRRENPVLKHIIVQQLLDETASEAIRAEAAGLLSFQLRGDDELFAKLEQLSQEVSESQPVLKEKIDFAISIARQLKPRSDSDGE